MKPDPLLATPSRYPPPCPRTSIPAGSAPPSRPSIALPPDAPPEAAPALLLCAGAVARGGEAHHAPRSDIDAARREHVSREPLVVVLVLVLVLLGACRRTRSSSTALQHAPVGAEEQRVGAARGGLDGAGRGRDCFDAPRRKNRGAASVSELAVPAPAPRVHLSARADRERVRRSRSDALHCNCERADPARDGHRRLVAVS
mmetsp:Transcript_44270/g.139494  ORF Transcript_44270/g.139494 Transcript_44270/m.139494 type:complete len:201 (-) Transcript_44270:408-1010(-)